MFAIQSSGSSPTSLPAGTVLPPSKNMACIPPLSVNLREKWRSIAVTWSIIILFTCVLDELFYFVLRYGAKTTTDVALTVPTAILGVFSVLTIGFRTYQLLKRDSDRRPIGGAWWAVRRLPRFLAVPCVQTDSAVIARLLQLEHHSRLCSRHCRPRNRFGRGSTKHQTGQHAASHRSVSSWQPIVSDGHHELDGL